MQLKKSESNFVIVDRDVYNSFIERLDIKIATLKFEANVLNRQCCVEELETIKIWLGGLII